MRRAWLIALALCACSRGDEVPPRVWVPPVTEEPSDTASDETPGARDCPHVNDAYSVGRIACAQTHVFVRVYPSFNVPDTVPQFALAGWQFEFFCDGCDVPHEVHEGEMGIIGVDGEAPLDIASMSCPWTGSVWHPLALSGAYTPGYSTALPDSPEEPYCPEELAILVSAQFIDGTEDCYVRGKNAEAIAEERGCSFYPAWFHNPDW